MNSKLILEQQLAIDYNCTLAEVQGSKNMIKSKKQNTGARPVGDADSMLKIICYGGKLLVMADEKLLEWCREKLEDFDAAWISEPQTLCAIHEKLKEYGQCLADTHHYYIPVSGIEFVEKRFETEWYMEKEILRFEGDERFDEAFLFDERIPDMVAVAAVEQGKILGMAGATADCGNMWQIGVNVTEEGKGKGVGTYVTALLKNKILEMGKVPFYSTVESHIKSQRVAVQAGFMPAFYEIYSKISK